MARKQFTELKERDGQIPDAELDDFWSSLEPASIDFMIGEWKGGEFDTGHRANGFMKRLNWFGKTFNSTTDAKPLVCLDDDGNKFSNTEAMNGEASLLDGGVPRRRDRQHGVRREDPSTTTSRRSTTTRCWAS